MKDDTGSFLLGFLMGFAMGVPGLIFSSYAGGKIGDGAFWGSIIHSIGLIVVSIGMLLYAFGG